MVHVAVHDAVQAYEKRFHSYSGDITGASGSPVAAIATAAHDVLVDIYSIYPWIVADADAKYMQYLTANGLIGDPEILVGQQAALGIINLRVNDGPRRVASDGIVQSAAGHLPASARTPSELRADGRSVARKRAAVYLDEPVAIPRRPTAVTDESQTHGCTTR